MEKYGRAGQATDYSIIGRMRIACWRTKVKVVKCTLVQALRLCTGRTAHRESSIALRFHDHGSRRGVRG